MLLVQLLDRITVRVAFVDGLADRGALQVESIESLVLLDSDTDDPVEQVAVLICVVGEGFQLGCRVTQMRSVRIDDRRL